MRCFPDTAPCRLLRTFESQFRMTSDIDMGVRKTVHKLRGVGQPPKRSTNQPIIASRELGICNKESFGLHMQINEIHSI